MYARNFTRCHPTARQPRVHGVIPPKLGALQRESCSHVVVVVTRDATSFCLAQEFETLLIPRQRAYVLATWSYGTAGAGSVAPFTSKYYLAKRSLQH